MQCCGFTGVYGTHICRPRPMPLASSNMAPCNRQLTPVTPHSTSSQLDVVYKKPEAVSMKALSGLESQIECFLEKFYVYGLRVIHGCFILMCTCDQSCVLCTLSLVRLYGFLPFTRNTALTLYSSPHYFITLVFTLSTRLARHVRLYDVDSDSTTP